MSSLYRERGRWVVAWCAPWQDRRTKRKFRHRRAAEALKRDVERAIERDDRAEVERLSGRRARAEGREALVEAFMRTLRADCSTSYRKQTRARLEVLLDAMEVRGAHDVDLDRALRCLDSAGAAPKTRHDLAALLRKFARWLHATRRLAADPLAALDTGGMEPTYERRAFTEEEAWKLIQAAPVRPVQVWARRHPRTATAYLDRLRALGEERALVYACAFALGLREGELRALEWRDVRLDDAEVDVRAEVAKARRRELVAVPVWLVVALAARRAELERTGPVDPRRRVLQVGHDIAQHVRKDARFAGIEFDDDRTVGLHCARHSLATWLEDWSVAGGVADAVTRHAPTGSTRRRRYVHVRPEQLHEVAALVPDLLADEWGAQRGARPASVDGLRRTSTDTRAETADAAEGM